MATVTSRASGAIRSGMICLDVGGASGTGTGPMSCSVVEVTTDGDSLGRVVVTDATGCNRWVDVVGAA